MNLNVDVNSKVVFRSYVQQSYAAIRSGKDYHVLNFQNSPFSQTLEERTDNQTECVEGRYRIAVGKAIEQNGFDINDVDVFLIHLDDFRPGVDLPLRKEDAKLLWKKKDSRVWYEPIYGPGNLEPFRIQELVSRIDSQEFLRAA